jgi:hypothetical protein
MDGLLSQDRSKIILKDVLIVKEINELLGDCLKIDMNYCINNRVNDKILKAMESIPKEILEEYKNEDNSSVYCCDDFCSACSLLDYLLFQENVFYEGQESIEDFNDFIKQQGFYTQNKYLYIKLDRDLFKETDEFKYKFRGTLTLSSKFKLQEITVDNSYFIEKIFNNWKITRINKLFNTLQLAPFIPSFENKGFKGSIARYYLNSETKP